MFISMGARLPGKRSQKSLPVPPTRFCCTYNTASGCKYVNRGINNLCKKVLPGLLQAWHLLSIFFLEKPFSIFCCWCQWLAHCLALSKTEIMLGLLKKPSLPEEDFSLLWRGVPFGGLLDSNLSAGISNPNPGEKQACTGDLNFCVWPAVCRQTRGLGRENKEETGLRECGSMGHDVDWLCELVLFQVGSSCGVV